MGFVIDPWPSYVHGRGVIEQVFLDRVLLQARDGGQPPGDRGAGASGCLEVASEQLDVGAADGEKAQLPPAAPGGDLAQVQGVCLPGLAGITRPGTPANASFSASENDCSITAGAADELIEVVMGYLLGVRAEATGRPRRRLTTST